MTPRRISGFIRGSWQQRAAPDPGLEQALAGLVGPQIASGRLQLVRQEDTLVAVCRDRALCTELRFQQREIIKTVRAGGYPQVERMRVALGGATRASEPVAEPHRRTIPDSARESLEQTAAAMDDTRLASALRRLARLHTGPQE
ncbi:DciA family protein [Thioalkalivibrio sp. ALJ24]|uniref:DciA family protein n=1 Tax=Thioalkalivibrio sp. ALJ24 TaxID=545276 RepID=UPI000380672F|nr:DciA family protein [Thioalkalivibrio sp. ALJ24]